MSGPHRLPPDAFDALCASGGTVDHLAALRRGQVSKRLLQLRVLLDALDERPDVGAAAGLPGNVAALTAVQTSDRPAMAEVLVHPQFGAWVSGCLRRLRKGGAPAHPTPPAERTAEPLSGADVAHLGSFALAAAIRAGRPASVTVPVRESGAVIPGWGRIRLPAVPAGLASVECAGPIAIHAAHARAVVPSDPRSGHPYVEPLRRLTAEVDGLRVDLELDDLDPYRAYPGLVPADRLADPAVHEWRHRLDRAWAILVAGTPARAAAIAAGTRSLVPMRTVSGRRVEVSATSRDANGAVALTMPASGLSLAVTLVHEAQHSTLNALHDMIALIEPGRPERYYSPWRDDPRPLNGLLHGTYAFLGVGDFWRGVRAALTADPALAEFELARVALQVATGHASLRAAPGLTPAGHRLVAALGAELDRLRAERVSAPARRAAAEAVAAHEAAWRRRNG